MQFDKTRIAIRERSFLDILDLALQVIREHARPLALWLAAGIVPFALLNTLLLGGLVESTLELEVTYDFAEMVGGLALFVVLLGMLVVLEIPLATSLATLYLGKALFEEAPAARQIVGDLSRSLPQLLLFQVFLRSLTIPFVVTWFIPFAVWPYLNEVILLERNPLRRRRAGAMSTFARSSNLHSAGSGEQFGRWLASAIFGICWVLVLWLALYVLRTYLTGLQEHDWALYMVYLQLAIWIVVGYFTVVRFLSYLDTRIKTEGWEVELRLRAEAARLNRQTSWLESRTA